MEQKKLKLYVANVVTSLLVAQVAGTNHLKRHMLNSCKRKNQMDIRDFQQLGKDKEGKLTTFILQ